MYGIGNKKMLNMFILEILHNYTDEDHSDTTRDYKAFGKRLWNGM